MNTVLLARLLVMVNRYLRQALGKHFVGKHFVAVTAGVRKRSKRVL
jgi:hypothetical protein